MPELRAGLSHGDKCGAGWMEPIACSSIAWRAGASAGQRGVGAWRTERKFCKVPVGGGRVP